VARSWRTDHVLDLRIAHHDGRSLVGTHVLVEEEVEIRGAREHVEHGAQGHVLQFEGDRLGHRAPQLQQGDRGLGGLLVDRSLQLARLALHRVFRKHRREQLAGVAVFFRLDELVRLGDQRAMAPVGLDLHHALGSPRVRGVVPEHAAVELLGRLQLCGRSQNFGLREPLRHSEVALPEIFRAVGVIPGIFPGGLLQLCERLVRAAFARQLARVLDQGVGGASRDEHAGGERRTEGFALKFHGVSPSLTGRK